MITLTILETMTQPVEITLGGLIVLLGLTWLTGILMSNAFIRWSMTWGEKKL